jgi:hypothetical protein
MRLSKLILTILIPSLSLPVFSQSVGTTIFEFLKTPYSARGAAMANNLVAIKGDVDAMFYNPAALSDVENNRWTINYVNHLLDLQGGQLAYVRNSKIGNIGVGLVYFNYGDFQETNQFGEQTGRDFSASEFAFAASLSNTLGEGFDYGVNLKYIYSSLDIYNASGLAFDGGIIYTSAKFTDLQIGLSISNVGFILNNYAETREKMPLYLRLGFSKRLEHLPLLFSASLNDMTLNTGETIDILKRFSIGGEFDISQVIKLRVGYDNGINQNVKSSGGRSFGGISAGLGINWNDFRLDYAFSNYGDLGSQNRLGITGGF